MAKNTTAPKTPGDLGNVRGSIVDKLADGNVDALTEGLEGLTDEELSQLLAIESSGKGRTGAIDAISREQARRTVPDSTPPALSDTGVAPIGDTDSADLRAADVDPAKIERPTLTRDGWVLPKPRANAEG